ncbi:MAG TPA: DNRLRE domain-containing protein [Caproiciproducens sp.]|nr:DNRLRE domain-containing protein [Caproiciproducens sp.]
MPSISINLPNTTFVSSAQPDMNLSFYPLLYAGTDPSFGTCIGLVQIPLPSLPVMSVDSALLQLAVIVKSGAAPSPILVNRVIDPFSKDTVTFNTRPAFTATASQYDVSSSDLYTSIQIDITDTVNGWLNGSYANNGLALTNPDGISIVQFGTDKIGYEPYFPKLILAYSSTPVPSDFPYGRVYNTGNQAVAVGTPVPLNHSGPLYKVSHPAGSGAVTLEQAGLYAAWFTVSGQSANQFALFQNQAMLLDSIGGVASGENSGTATINAAGGDSLTLKNVSGGTVTLNNAAGGTMANVSASIFLMKIGQSVSPDPVLANVNAAQGNGQMDAAIRNPALGLDLTGYNALAYPAQSQVLSGLLTNRPPLGYLAADYLQQMLNYQVGLVQTVVDPGNIYVLSGAANGNGSLAKPFGTIPEGIAAVVPGGTVHILAGDYPITATIKVNKNGITLSGDPGNKLLLQAPISAIFISGDGVTIQNLTVTSINAYLAAFIEVAGNNAILRNNNIYGPPTSGVVNRGILLDNNRSSIIVENNYIHSLVHGILISAGVQGTLNNNHIEGTQTGIFVFSGSLSITGNYWSGVRNTYDIGLNGTISGNYQIDQLSAANNGAKVQIF